MVEVKPEEPAPPPPAVEVKVETPAVVKVEVPEIEAPKVINKIDLSAIDSSTRPKKAAKKKEETPVEEPAPAPKAKKAEPAVEVKPEPPAPTPAPVVPAVTEEVETAPVIENIRAEKLEGPKILGKIELPVNSDTRPKPAARDEKA